MAARYVLLRRIELPIDRPLQDFRAFRQLLALLDRTPRLAGHIRTINVRDWPGVAADEVAPLIAAALGMVELRMVAPLPFVNGVLNQISALVPSLPALVRLSIVLDYVNAMASLSIPLAVALATFAASLEVLELRTGRGTGLELPALLHLPRLRVLHTHTRADTALRLINASPRLVDLELDVPTAAPFVGHVDEAIARRVRRLTIRSTAWTAQTMAPRVTRLFESVTALDLGPKLDVPDFDAAPWLESLTIDLAAAASIVGTLGHLTMPTRLRHITLRGTAYDKIWADGLAELRALGERVGFTVSLMAAPKPVHELEQTR